jgi:hypothetical protein
MRLTPILVYTLMPLLMLVGGVSLLLSAFDAADRSWMISLGVILLASASAMASYLPRKK